MTEVVALVSAVDPYPTDAGKKVVLAGFVEYLVARVGPDNVHYMMVGGPGERRFPAQCHTLPKPRALRALGSVVTRAGTGRSSLQESLLRTPEVGAAIHRTLDTVAPSLEIYDTVRMSQYAPEKSGAQQICYLDDLFSERYRMMLGAAEKYRDVDIAPLGNFATHVPRTLRPAAEHQRSQRLLLNMEQHLVRRSEDRTARRFDNTLLMNEHEADLLRHRSGTDTRHVQAIPPLIRPSTSVRRTYRGAPEFIFLGQLSLPHNDDGLRSFLCDVWPRVLAARADAQLRIVGRSPRPALVDLASHYKGSVVFDGFVPDLGEVLGRAAALINPLRFGSGVKLKIIESLGCGVPVISTTVGADGVAIGPDHGVLVADDHSQLAELMLSVTDTAQNRRLSAAAREHFTKQYSRDAVFARYDAAFGLG